MHPSSLSRMSWFVQTYVDSLNQNTPLRVLDVGSYDVNGTYRHIFNYPKFEYFGLDIEDGPNVDIVVKNPYNWDILETDSFDIVISGQAFEHIEFFWRTMEEMTRVCKKGGLICIIAPSEVVEHRYPVDCYRFYADGMIALARYVCIEPLHAHTNCAPIEASEDWFQEDCIDSMLVARKPYSGAPIHPDFKEYVFTPIIQEYYRGDLRRHQSLLERLKFTQQELSRTQAQLRSMEQEMAQMKRSKFWKMRSLWLKLKRTFGLG